jgi:hypothetical protein
VCGRLEGAGLAGAGLVGGGAALVMAHGEVAVGCRW